MKEGMRHTSRIKKKKMKSAASSDLQEKAARQISICCRFLQIAAALDKMSIKAAFSAESWGIINPVKINRLFQLIASGVAGSLALGKIVATMSKHSRI